MKTTLGNLIAFEVIALVCSKCRSATFGTCLNAEAPTSKLLPHTCMLQRTSHLIMRVPRSKPTLRMKELFNQHFKTAAELLSLITALVLNVPDFCIFFHFNPFTF
jgi:hypothetical protein